MQLLLIIQSVRKGQKLYKKSPNILKAKFLQSCNESQKGISEDDLFGQIVPKSLSKISN